MGNLDFRERYFMAWAENNGYHMGFCVDADIDQGSILNNQNLKVICYPGHTEYWSRPERSNIESKTSLGFKGKGGHLAFYASNNCYWRVDFSPLNSANPDNMVCYKDKAVSARWGQYLWRYQTEGPEAKFIGIQFEAVNQQNRSNIVKNASHWTFRGTGLINEKRFGLGGNGYDSLAAGESDMIMPSSPSNVLKLAEVYTATLPDTVAHGDEVTTVYSHVAYYEDQGTNSRIYAAGGMGWSSCLFGTDASVMRTITTNTLDHLSWKKYIGNIYTDQLKQLTWETNIQLDGYVNVLTSKYLVINGTESPITVQIDSAINVYGTLEIKGNVTFSGSGNIIVQNNGSLLIDPGATITLTNGKSIIVNNSTITALANSASPITFDFVSQRTSSPFNGIIMNSGSTGNFSYSTIKNAYYGLSAYSAVVAMTNCDIFNCYDAVYLNYVSNSSIFSLNKFHDNTDSGFRLFSNSSPYITQNQFYNNFNGVLCQDNSSPSFRNSSSSYTGKNDIYMNRMGFTCSAATPWLGSLTLPSFNNMIENNNTNNVGYDVRLYNGCTVQASKVWWGSPGTNPPTSPYIKIYNGTGGGTLVMLSPLQFSPSSMLVKALAVNGDGVSFSSQSSESASNNNTGSLYDMLFQAESYFSQKSYSIAENICKSIIETYPDSAASLSAVDLLCNVANESKDNTLKHYLEKFQTKGTKNLYGNIERILAGYEKENRIEKLDNIIKKYSNFPIQVQYAMLEKVVYYLYEKNDYNKALSVSQKMNDLFPDEFSTLQVEEALGLSPQKTKKNLQLINKDVLNKDNKPDKYELNVNYPNPFNPNTVIKFSLPEDNLTTLKVFDALGREVATLVNEVKQAASYEVTFNAGNLPSGLYIYRIKSGKFIESRKMLLVK
ncbi:MAG: N,N-dimethylformamidase beta subunit family domain-containing protein [Clostridiales bacterium]